MQSRGSNMLRVPCDIKQLENMHYKSEDKFSAHLCQRYQQRASNLQASNQSLNHLIRN